MIQTWFTGHPVLEALGEGFDVEVAAEHVEQAVVSVEGSILLSELIMNSTVGGAVEVIDVRLRDGWTGESDKRASAKADCGEVR